MPVIPALPCHSRVGGNLDTCFRRDDIKMDCFVGSRLLAMTFSTTFKLP
ncbi:hypothetical protein [Candidatus Tisiphia endosymbiont of Hybos culiciformis]